DGAIGQLLRETGGGEAIAQSDIEGQARAIRKFYDNWLTGRSPSSEMDSAAISAYERREATRKLADVFNSIVSRENNSPESLHE
ncbi:MAG: hypothetical protein ABI778_04715, partial [Ignavibacteriota bacterium]